MIDYNWKKTLSGERTQIRLPVKPNHHALNVWRTELGSELRIGESGDSNRIGVVQALGRDIYQVGKTYAVQPGRGTKAIHWRNVAGLFQTTYDKDCPESVRANPSKYDAWQPLRIRILSIRREDVRQISDADVKAEGFTSAARFFDTWIGMHDSKLNQQIGHWFVSRRAAVSAEDAANIYRLQMQDRPAERYEAWALTFEVVK